MSKQLENCIKNSYKYKFSLYKVKFIHFILFVPFWENVQYKEYWPKCLLSLAGETIYNVTFVTEGKEYDLSPLL